MSVEGFPVRPLERRRSDPVGPTLERGRPAGWLYGPRAGSWLLPTTLMREGCEVIDKNQKAMKKTKSVWTEKDCEARLHKDCERNEKNKKHR